MNESNNGIEKLAEALSKAQKAIKAPLKNRHVDYKDKNNRSIKYSYADLADVLEAIREPFAENGLSISHSMTYKFEIFGLETILMHSSGQFRTSFYPLPDPAKNTIRAQEFGSALTYARRYSASSIAGIASEEDDDGQLAAPVENKKQAAPQTKAQEKPKAQPKQPTEHELALNELYSLVDTVGISADQVKGYMAMSLGFIKKSSDLTIGELDSLIKMIKDQTGQV